MNESSEPPAASRGELSSPVSIPGSGDSFASGGQTVAKNWNDADVQAALAAAKR